jgi:hypothetical protein
MDSPDGTQTVTANGGRRCVVYAAMALVSRPPDSRIPSAAAPSRLARRISMNCWTSVEERPDIGVSAHQGWPADADTWGTGSPHIVQAVVPASPLSAPQHRTSSRRHGTRTARRTRRTACRGCCGRAAHSRWSFAGDNPRPEDNTASLCALATDQKRPSVVGPDTRPPTVGDFGRVRRIREVPTVWHDSTSRSAVESKATSRDIRDFFRAEMHAEIAILRTS